MLENASRGKCSETGTQICMQQGGGRYLIVRVPSIYTLQLKRTTTDIPQTAAVWTYSRMNGKSHYNMHWKFSAWWLPQSTSARCSPIFSLMPSLVCLLVAHLCGHTLLSIFGNRHFWFRSPITIITWTPAQDPWLYSLILLYSFCLMYSSLWKTGIHSVSTSWWNILSGPYST